MTRQEQDTKMLDWYKAMEEVGLPFYLNQSTLLAIYRDGKNFDNNRSIDIAVLADDLRDKEAELRKRREFFNQNISEDPTIMGLMYFDRNDVEVQPVHFIRENAVYYLGNGVCIYFPEKMLRKENWKKIKYLDKEWNIPGFTDEYLAFTYGEDWRTPRASWHWMSDQKNIKSLHELK